MTSEASPPLLVYLDHRVRGRAGPPGFRGRVCLGVESEHARHYWIAALGNNVETQFVEDQPPDADAYLLMGVREAEEIFLRGRAPINPKHLETYGDVTLLRRLFQRYLARPTLLAARSWSGGE